MSICEGKEQNGFKPGPLNDKWKGQPNRMLSRTHRRIAWKLQCNSFQDASLRAHQFDLGSGANDECLPFVNPNKSIRCHSLRTQGNLSAEGKNENEKNFGSKKKHWEDRNSPENPFGKIIVEISSNFVLFILCWIAAGHPVIDLIIIFYHLNYS